MCAALSCGDRWLNVSYSFQLCPYVVCTSSEISGETARVCMLARLMDFAARTCDKYQTLVNFNWLNSILTILVPMEFPIKVDIIKSG